MVKRSDWKTMPMPEQKEHFTLEKILTAEDILLIQEGHKPQEMEDKWFMFAEKEKLYIHRSWTGFCIYIIDVNTTGKLEVIVNRDSGQYQETMIEKDRIQVNILLNILLKEHSQTAQLMKEYFARD